MALRPLLLTDLPDVAALYVRMLREDPDAGGYPHDLAQTPGDLIAWLAAGLQQQPGAWILLGAVRDTLPGPFGEPTGGTLEGVLVGQIYRRPTGTPRDVGFVEWVYTVPERRGFGNRLAIRLMLAAAQEIARRCPGAVIEGGYRPGSHAERIWTRLGMRPYMVRCAFTDAAGRARPLSEMGLMRRAARANRGRDGVSVLGRRRQQVS